MERITRAAEALGISIPTGPNRLFRYIIIWTITLGAALTPVGLSMAAGNLSTTAVGLSDPRPSQTGVNYTFTGSSVDGATAVKCVKAVWTTTATGDTAPTGFSAASGSVTAAGSTLINSSASGWSLAKSDGTGSSGQNNIYQYTNSSGVTPGTTSGATFVLGGITNSSVADTAYYFRLNTYSNTNCSSGPIDNATVEFINTNGSTLSLAVDPSLSFTVNSVNNGDSCAGTTTTGTSTATTIPFGAVTTATNAVICQDLTAATNAPNGYTIYLRYTGKPQNANLDVIADHSGTNDTPTTFSAAGTEAYGYATDDTTLSVIGAGADRFTNGGQKWAAATTSNAEVAYASASTTATTYRVGHQVGISNTTPGGTYSTTVIYTCTPVY